MHTNDTIDPATGSPFSPVVHCAIGAEQYDNEKERAAYEQGYNHSHGIACHNVPTLGAKIFSEDLGRMTVDATNIREIHESECHAAADNARCYSPFEFTAAEFNADDDDSESLWEAFEAGTADAINRDLSEYGDSDYGIEPTADSDDSAN